MDFLALQPSSDQKWQRNWKVLFSYYIFCLLKTLNLFLLNHFFLFFCLIDHPEVIILIENRKLVMQTTRTWDYLGLFSTPASSNGLLNETNMGSGAIIGVIDSGIIYYMNLYMSACYILSLLTRDYASRDMVRISGLQRRWIWTDTITMERTVRVRRPVRSWRLQQKAYWS